MKLMDALAVEESSPGCIFVAVATALISMLYPFLNAFVYKGTPSSAVMHSSVFNHHGEEILPSKTYRKYYNGSIIVSSYFLVLVVVAPATLLP